MSSLSDILAVLATEPCSIPEDLSKILPRGERHPNDRVLGPLKPRGAPSGLVLVGGREAGSFGDIDAPEVTFSVAKSYLSALTGIACREGLIASLDEPVHKRVRDGGFDSEQNRLITWRHLLEQTSEWEGELFGVPDWLDRGRVVGGSDGGGGDGTVGGSATGVRELQRPGTFWEYNDVRVNRLSLSLLRLFGEPLPVVLKREIMAPLGSDGGFQWHGYETSTVEVAGQQIESVSGGTHWGGGLWVCARDHARLGELYRLGGRAPDGTQIFPAGWVRETLEPSALNPAYGFLWWLNTDGSLSDIAGKSAFAARGAGGHQIFVCPERQITIVLRWIVEGKRAVDAILRNL